MRRSGVGSGGGYKSNKHVDSRAPKTEPKAHRVREAGVGQLGQKQGAHVTNQGPTNYRGEKLYGGRGYEPPKMISDPVKAVGVGGGRKIYQSGSQQQYGSGGEQKPSGREILGAFGPESSRPRGED